MKISWLIVFLFTICIESAFTPAYASYAPHYETTDVAKSSEDGFLVRLSRSNYHYDNVGMLYYCDAKLKQPRNSDFRFLASVVYIGDGMCLTAAHTHTKLFDMTNRNSAVCFEINRKRTPFYHVVEYFIHPDYEKNYHFDIAVLVLNKPVDGLTGLEPCYDFSQHRKFYKDNLHLLTYIGYGAKLLWNDWFCFTDKKRRATQAYTHSCEVDPNVLGIYSTPYGNSNDFKQ